VLSPPKANWKCCASIWQPQIKPSLCVIARALGFPNWNTTNLLYGKFAGKLCNELNVSPTTNLSVLVKFYKAPSSEYDLCLRPSVIEALRELEIGGRGTWSFQEELGIEGPLVEGASFTVQVSAFERNPVARQKCIAHYGPSCSVCGFNFGNTYGSSAENYIHVHHLKPLASIGEEYVIDPNKDHARAALRAVLLDDAFATNVPGVDSSTWSMGWCTQWSSDNGVMHRINASSGDCCATLVR
jgi:hypothetical protein